MDSRKQKLDQPRACSCNNHQHPTVPGQKRVIERALHGLNCESSSPDTKLEGNCKVHEVPRQEYPMGNWQ